MAGRALDLISLMSSSLNHVTINVHQCQCSLKFDDLQPDSEVIILGKKDKESGREEEKVMRYGEVVERLGERKLVRVTTTKSNNSKSLPKFKMMSVTDLEVGLNSNNVLSFIQSSTKFQVHWQIATRMARDLPGTYLGKKTILGRII